MNQMMPAGGINVSVAVCVEDSCDELAAEAGDDAENGADQDCPGRPIR